MSEYSVFILFIIAITAAIFFKGMAALPVILISVAFGGIYLYLRGKYYLVETYGNVIMEDDSARPYDTRPIMSVTDYDDTGDSTPNPLPYDDPVRKALEMDIIAANRAEKSSAIRRNRLNAIQYKTSRLPPDSQVRVQDEVNWVATPAVLEGFSTIEATAFNPPDKDAIESKERQFLATYVPKTSADLNTYSIEDADTLIKKIYKERKQVPSYRKREEDGVYEVYEVKDENPVIVWEDEVASATTVGMPHNEVKVPVIPDQSTLIDPYFEPMGRGKLNRADYTVFTPGLERMFAPTNPTTNWY
jgi:hypothetical protein